MLLKLAYNKTCISSATAKHEATLHLIDLISWPGGSLRHRPEHLHHLATSSTSTCSYVYSKHPMYPCTLKFSCKTVGMHSSEITHLENANFPNGLQHLRDSTRWSGCLARNHLADDLCDNLQGDWLTWAVNWAFVLQVFLAPRELNVEKKLIMLFPSFFLCILI